MTAFILSAVMALICLAIACAAAEVHPLQAAAEFCRVQFAPDRSPDWAAGELTGEQPVVRFGKHDPANPDLFSGTEAQRRHGDTMTLPRITDDIPAGAR